MTSTASRLATVQQKIEKLAVELNPDQANRKVCAEMLSSTEKPS